MVSPLLHLRCDQRDLRPLKITLPYILQPLATWSISQDELQELSSWAKPQPLVSLSLSATARHANPYLHTKPSPSLPIRSSCAACGPTASSSRPRPTSRTIWVASSWSRRFSTWAKRTMTPCPRLRSSSSSAQGWIPQQICASWRPTRAWGTSEPPAADCAVRNDTAGKAVGCVAALYCLQLRFMRPLIYIAHADEKGSVNSSPCCWSKLRPEIHKDWNFAGYYLLQAVPDFIRNKASPLPSGSTRSPWGRARPQSRRS